MVAKGELVELEIEGVPETLQVWTPEVGHRPESWPIVIYFHGTNGKPTVDLMRFASGGEDYLIAGTTYLKRGRLDYSEENLEAEIVNLRKIVKTLVEDYQGDGKRVFVAGFSKGGWASSAFLERMPELAGAIVMGGGVFDKGRREAKPLRQKPMVYIGCGRQDGNYPQSLRALLHFRKLGARVTLEAWPDLGHSFPRERPEGLRQWLLLQSKRPDLAELKENWLGRHLAMLAKIDDIVARWRAVTASSTLPFLKGNAELAQLQKAVEEHVETKDEREARRLIRTALREEIKDRYVETLHKVLPMYRAVARTFPQTIAGKEAEGDILRIAELLRHQAPPLKR